MVVAAETGSGKTHGYLVPLINRLCSANDDSGNVESDQGTSAAYKISLVLCPNVTLCEQVARMANGLCGDDGQPLVAVSAVCGRQVIVASIVLLFLFFSLVRKGFHSWIMVHCFYCRGGQSIDPI